MGKASTAIALLCMRPAGAIQLQVNEDDPCTCLHWADAYSTKYNTTFDCGHEFDLAGDTENDPMGNNTQHAVDIPDMTFLIGVHFFGAYHKSNHSASNACVLAKPGPSTKSWCYVAPECEKGTTQWYKPQSPLKTKICETGKDTMLGDLEPNELMEFFDSENFDKGQGVQFAYPLFDGNGSDLLDTIGYWGLEAPFSLIQQQWGRNKPITEELRAKVQAVVDSGKPTIFLSPNTQPPMAVAIGQKLYWINHSKKYLELKARHQDVWKHKDVINEIKCVHGCDENAAVW